jgi:hypothetical protein
MGKSRRRGGMQSLSNIASGIFGSSESPEITEAKSKHAIAKKNFEEVNVKYRADPATFSKEFLEATSALTSATQQLNTALAGQKKAEIPSNPSEIQKKEEIQPKLAGGYRRRKSRRKSKRKSRKSVRRKKRFV